jgi:hypothetical protein
VTTPRPINLSSPRRIKAPPRPVSDVEFATLARLADLLIPGNADDPAPSAADGYRDKLTIALAARSDAFESIVEYVAKAHDRADTELLEEFRAAHAAGEAWFQILSTVLAGAYLLLPEVRTAIGYPGQHRDVPRVDEAAEQIGDGILDPVMARGPIYVSVEPID